MPPDIQYKISEKDDRFIIEFCAESFAKSVCLDLSNGDGVFSDNWFDIHGGESVIIEILKDDISRSYTRQEFEEALVIYSNYEG